MADQTGPELDDSETKSGQGVVALPLYIIESPLRSVAVLRCSPLMTTGISSPLFLQHQTIYLLAFTL